MNISKCPYCKNIITTVITEDVTMTIGVGKPAWNGLSHACPLCHVVLGVEVNPLVIQGKILDALDDLRKDR